MLSFVNICTCKYSKNFGITHKYSDLGHDIVGLMVSFEMSEIHYQRLSFIIKLGSRQKRTRAFASVLFAMELSVCFSRGKLFSFSPFLVLCVGWALSYPETAKEMGGIESAV